MRNFSSKLRGAFKSVTVLVNAFMLALLPFYEDVVDQLPQLQPYLPENVYKKVGIAVVVLNIVLRFRTRRPLEHK